MWATDRVTSLHEVQVRRTRAAAQAPPMLQICLGIAGFCMRPFNEKAALELPQSRFLLCGQRPYDQRFRLGRPLHYFLKRTSSSRRTMYSVSPSLYSVPPYLE